MSASAGSAITASPIQLGATTSIRPGSDIGPPSSMHPEPEVRVPTDVHLQHVGTALREFANGIRRVRRGRLNGVLEDHTVAALWQRQDERRDNGSPGSQGE